jgi:hypothetical protein
VVNPFKKLKSCSDRDFFLVIHMVIKGAFSHTSKSLQRRFPKIERKGHPEEMQCC